MDNDHDADDGGSHHTGTPPARTPTSRTPTPHGGD
jgi:hypothetical protein